MKYQLTSGEMEFLSPDRPIVISLHDGTIRVFPAMAAVLVAVVIGFIAIIGDSSCPRVTQGSPDKTVVSSSDRILGAFPKIQKGTDILHRAGESHR